MGKYQDDSIKSIVKKINEKYFLPDMQREFVWDSDEAPRGETAGYPSAVLKVD